MAVIAVVVVVKFIIDCRKEERFVIETLPSAGEVSRERVHDALERFKHYRGLWAFNRLAVVSCGTVPGGEPDEYIFQAGTSSVKVLCLLARDVASEDPIASLVGEAPARFLPKLGRFCTWRWPDARVAWRVKLKYDKSTTRTSYEGIEATMFAYFDAVVRMRLPQPWFIEVAGHDVLFVFPLAKVHEDVDKLVELHARLHEDLQD